MKKWIVLVIVFCFGFGDLKSQNDEENPLSNCVVRTPIYIGFNSSLNYTDFISNEIGNSENQNNFSFGLHIEDFLYDPSNYYSSIKYGINFTNLGYGFQKDNLNQNYNLSYLSANVNYKRLLFDSQFYAIGGLGLNYLYDVESEIETLNVNNEKIVVNNDLNGSEISNNYNRFDLVGSVGVGYDILLENCGCYISIEPKYNFSFLNHINRNNQELKGMNFKNEYWSLNFGVTFAL